MDDKQLNELLDLTRENNKILKGMRSSNRWGSFFKFIYYGLIMGLMVSSYYFIQPMIEPLLKTFQGLTDSVQNVKGGLQNAGGNLNISPEMIDQLKKTLNL